MELKTRSLEDLGHVQLTNNYLCCLLFLNGIINDFVLTLSVRLLHVTKSVAQWVRLTQRALLAKRAYHQCWRVRVRVQSGTLDLLP